MSEDIKGTPVVPVVEPDKKPSGGINLATADLSLLKAEFDKAVADRAAIDARIDGLRKAIANRLKEFQNLNDRVSNIQGGFRRPSGITLPSIPWGKFWSFLVHWFIPATLLFIVLWYGVKAVKYRYTTPKTDVIPIEQSIIPGHNVWMELSEEEALWS